MSKTRLTDLQLRVMRVLWLRGEATVAHVRDAMEGSDARATTTFATILSRLEKQGVVSRRTDSRQYVYRPAVSESEVRDSMVAGIVHGLFEGDSAALVSHLVSDAEIGDADIERLRALLNGENAGEVSNDR